MNYLKWFLFLNIFVGCLATSKGIIGPDGTRNELISCPDIEHCYNKARKICKGNYSIVNTNSKVTSGIDNKPETEIQLLIKCDQQSNGL